MFFRSLRARTGVLTSSRLPMRLNAHTQHHASPNIQRVRLQRMGARPRTMIFSVLGVLTSFQVYSYVVLRPLQEAAAELEQSLDEETKKEMMEDDHPLFIPFPGTIKQIVPHPYRGTDPEWQEFIKFSKDLALGKRVRDDLAEFVKSCVDKHPQIIMRCGKEMKIRRYWLDVDFPLAPPPEFERSGLEISDEFIAWTTMPVDSLTVFRIRQALWPSSLAQSFYGFFKVLVVQDIRIFGEKLGLVEPRRQPSFEALIARHLNKQSIDPGKPGVVPNGGSLKPPTLGNSKQSMPDGIVSKESGTTAKSSPDNDDKQAKLEARQAELETEIRNRVRDFKVAHFFRPLVAFKNKFTQTWRPAPNYPPRGSVILSGLVEIDSPKAWIVIDVKAAYDPKTKTFDSRCMSLALRRLQMKKQGPPGGPGRHAPTRIGPA